MSKMLLSWRKIRLIRRLASFLSYAAAILVVNTAIAQSSIKQGRVGQHIIEIFNPADFNGDVQTFSSTQAKDGRMYFANIASMLSYDGELWDKHELDGGRTISKLAITEDGTLFYGAAGDVGYFQSDENGELKSVSLLEQFPNPDIDFSLIWDIRTIGNQVYFRAQNILIRWKNNKIDVWEFEGGFRSIGVINERLYFQTREKNIYAVKNDKFELVAKSDDVGSRIGRFLDIGKKDEFLIVTLDDGIMKVNKGEIIPFESDIQEFVKNNRVHDAILAPDGNIILASAPGVHVFSMEGKLLAAYDKELLGNIVSYDLYFDRQGLLWIGGNRSIAKIEYFNPLTQIGENNGIKGNVNGLIEFNNSIYASTTAGMFEMSLNQISGQYTINDVEGINTASQSILKFNNQLLVGTQTGVYNINGNKGEQIGELDDVVMCTWMKRSKLDSNRILICSEQGLFSARWDGRKWKNVKSLMENKSCFEVIELKNGDLIAAGRSVNHLKLTYNPDYSEIKSVERKEFEMEGFHTVFQLGKENYLVNNSTTEIYSFDTDMEKFISVNNEFTKSLGFDESKVSVYNAGTTRIKDNRFVLLKIGNSNNSEPSYYIKYHSDKEETNLENKISINTIEGKATSGVFEDDQGLLWFYGVGGIYIYDKNFESYENQAPEVPLTISAVYYNTDSLLFAGYHNLNHNLPEIPHKGNSISFEYSLSSYYQTEKLYQYKLDGYEEEWSKLTTSTSKEYTNLNQGEYTFMVRGVDEYNNIGSVATYDFAILAPWYATWWAYIVYALTLVAILFTFDRIRWSKILMDKKRLEKIVEFRTREVNKQAQKLEQQTEKLRELDKLKSKFFANISHEFRTPITLIQGPLERLLDQNSSEINTSRLIVERMFRNSKRLHFLVNQLLDLVELDAGKVGLHIVHRNLCHFIRYFANSFSSLAESKNIEYIIDIPEHDIILPFDTDAIEKIYYNLLANAFKFTPEYGQIYFLIESLSSSKEKIIDVEKEKLAYIKTTVKDTGEGISPTMINQVFDRFAKNDESHNSGVGIGLSLVKELVELYGGELSVDSTLGVGTTFTVILPIDISLFDENVIKSITEYNDSDIENNILITQKPEELLPTRENQNALATDSDKAQVLVIEDNQDVRAYLVECLQQAYNVETAQNGREGLELIKETVPDLVISDIMMPEVDGITFLKTIKEDEITSHIPVVLLTAKADEKSKLEGYEFGADAYLVKPFSDKELLLRVKKIIEQREILIEKYTKEIVLKPSNIKIKSKDEVFIKKVIDAIEDNIDNTTFDVGDLQSLLGVSRMQLHRKLIALTKMSTTEFVKHIRLLRAEQLLKESNLRVSEVGYAVGFSDPSYFSKCFKEHFGVAPSSFAKEDN